MSYQENPSQLNPLAQIPLTKNPFIQLPQAVTLPYNYAPLPALSGLPAVSDLPPSSSASLPNDSTVLELRLKQGVQVYEAWKKQVTDRKIRQARKLAPGFLDTGVTMLTPTVARQPLPVAATPKEPAAMSKEDDYTNQFASLRF